MKRIVSIGLVALLTGCFGDGSSDATDHPSFPADGKTVQGTIGQVIATDLDVPWQINVIGPNEFYLSERGGNIAHVTNGSIERETLQLNKRIVAKTEGGMLGFLLFDTKSPMQAFVYHSYAVDGQLRNRVVKVEKDGKVWRETQSVIEDLPGGTIHNGGRMKIGPDHHLYITVGDSGQERLAQNLDSLAGKILRLRLDGRIPEDNPFPGSPIYSYGHRNPQGMVWTDDGTMYSSEHGFSAHDEINRIVPGGNYGWPVIQGDEKKEGMVSPIFQSGEETWAPSGMDVSGSKLYVACLAGEQIRMFDLVSKQNAVWTKGYGRMRDININGDALYAVTNNRDGRGNPDEEDDRLIRFQLRK